MRWKYVIQPLRSLYCVSSFLISIDSPGLNSVQLLSCVWLFATPQTAAYQASLSFKSVMPSNHLILCQPLLMPSIFPSIRVFSNELALHIRWPKDWSFSLSISPSNDSSGLISFRIDWFDLLAVQGLSRVFSNTIVQKHQFFGAQPSLWSNSHICTWLLEKHSFDYMELYQQSDVAAF